MRCEETIGWTEELLAEGRRAGVVKDAVTGRDLYHLPRPGVGGGLHG